MSRIQSPQARHSFGQLDGAHPIAFNPVQLYHEGNAIDSTRKNAAQVLCVAEKRMLAHSAVQIGQCLVCVAKTCPPRRCGRDGAAQSWSPARALRCVAAAAAVPNRLALTFTIAKHEQHDNGEPMSAC